MSNTAKAVSDEDYLTQEEYMTLLREAADGEDMYIFLLCRNMLWKVYYLDSLSPDLYEVTHEVSESASGADTLLWDDKLDTWFVCLSTILGECPDMSVCIPISLSHPQVVMGLMAPVS